MALGASALAVGLAAGRGGAASAALGFVLQRAVDTEALRHRRRASPLLAAEDALPDPLPVAGGQVRVQVVDAQGRVRAASIDADRLVPMLHAGRADAGPAGSALVDRRASGSGCAGPVRVVAVPAGTAADPLTRAGRPLHGRRAAQRVHVLRTILLVAFPLLVAVLAGGGLAGGGRRPCGRSRRCGAGAEEITGRAGAGRLPVPARRDEIHRLAVTLNGMLDRLESARARQRAFVADAAHELRSPLTNMRTELEVAQRLADRTDWPAVDRRPAHRHRTAQPAGRRPAAAGPRRTTAPAPARAPAPVELGALLAEVAARYPSPPVRVTPPAGPALDDRRPRRAAAGWWPTWSTTRSGTRTAVSCSLPRRVDGSRPASGRTTW